MKKYRIYAEITIFDSKCEVEVFIDKVVDDEIEQIEQEAINKILSNIKIDIINIIDDDD